MNTFITLHQRTFNLLFALFCTLCLKKTSPMFLAITIIFGRNITEKVGNQKILYFPTSHN